MKVIGAYAVVLNQEAARKQQEARGDARQNNDRPDADREPRPGLRARVRKLFGTRRVLREPGFAASNSWLDEFVPTLRAYPYPNAIR